jgi:hypothetical protein
MLHLVAGKRVVCTPRTKLHQTDVVATAIAYAQPAGERVKDPG